MLDRVVLVVAFACCSTFAHGQEPAPRAPAISPLFTARAARREAFRGDKVMVAVRAGIGWLVAHQDDDGKWDADNFMKHDGTAPCDGPGNAGDDIGITALALLAILAQADPANTEASHKAADWLANQFSPEGQVPAASITFIYDQAIATLALVEASALLNRESHRKVAAASLRYLQRHRSTTGGWRYQLGGAESDASITSWCCAAMVEAVHAGFEVPALDVGAALAWYDSATSFPDGTCGYTQSSEGSSRGVDEQDRFPPGKTEASTAAALHARLLTGLPIDAPLAVAAMNRMLVIAPSSDPQAADFYYWFHGSACAAMMPGEASKNWSAAMNKQLLASQCKEKNARGSWDVDCVWGRECGRVGITAFGVLALSNAYRLLRVDLANSLPADPPCRRALDALRADRVGQAEGELAKIKAEDLPDNLAGAVARARWLVSVELVHATRFMDLAAKLCPTVGERKRRLEALGKRLEGSTVGDRAANMIAEMKKDPAVQREVAAAKELRALQKTYDTVMAQPTAQRRQKLRDELTKFISQYANTEAAHAAEELLRSL